MTGLQWHERAAKLAIDGRAFINGQRVWAVSQQSFDDYSPIDGRLLAQVARGDVADIDAAVACARSKTGAGPANRRPRASAP